MRDPGPVCAHLLDVAAAALNTLDPIDEYVLVPDRQMVLHAPPAFDQELLTVHASLTGAGRPGVPLVLPANACQQATTITYTISLARWYPMVDEETSAPQTYPLATDETFWSTRLLTEATVLWNAMQDEVSAAIASMGHPLGNLGASLGPMEAVPPNGGIAGWTLVVTGT